MTIDIYTTIMLALQHEKESAEKIALEDDSGYWASAIVEIDEAAQYIKDKGASIFGEINLF